MKTAEERAQDVIEVVFDTPHNYELRQKNVGSIIRADREAVLSLLEKRFVDGPAFIGGSGALSIDDKILLAEFSFALNSVKKEAL